MAAMTMKKTMKTSRKKCSMGAIPCLLVLIAAPVLAALLLLVALFMWGFDLGDRDYGKHYRAP